jgi:alkylhydroperoxidase/carboxymuconolactone decarboxylase family protein YurZ
MMSIGYSSQRLSTALVIFNVLENTQTRIKNLNVFLRMPRKVRHLLNFQISCATNVSNNLNFYTVGFKKNGNCQKKFCQILLNFYSLKRSFRI